MIDPKTSVILSLYGIANNKFSSRNEIVSNLSSDGVCGRTVMAYTKDAEKAKSILRVFLRIISLLPITTLFQSFSAFSAINKLLIVLSVIFLFFSFFFLHLKVENWLQVILVVGLAAVDMCLTQESLVNSNMPVYLPFFVLLLVLVSEQTNLLRLQLREDVCWYRNICIIWCLLVVFSIPLSISYDEKGYFTSFTGNSFRTDPAALLILTYLILLTQYDKIYRLLSIIMSIVPLYCGFMGSSRTYFFVILLTYIIYLRCLIKDNKTFIICLVVAFAVMIPVILVSNIGQRMVNSLTESADGYYGYWASITSGRSRFWSYDIKHFFELPFLSQMLGAGYNQVFLFNRELGSSIWAHNDFINIAISNGYIGLILYFVSVYIFFKAYRYNTVSYSLGFLILMILIWVFNAFFNMVYTYTCATVALAVLPLVITDYQSVDMKKSSKAGMYL